MKVVLAPNAFKDSLSARQVATALARGLRRGCPLVQCVILPVADGGDGTLSVLEEALGATRREVTVKDPLGRLHSGNFLQWGRGEHGLVETAQATGLALLSARERNPLLTTSFGAGQLVRHALASGVLKLAVTVGGSGTNDGGAGFLQALGARFRDRRGYHLGQPLNGQALAAVRSVDLSALRQVATPVETRVLCDVDNPLCGPNGASMTFGPQKGADRATCLYLDENLKKFYQLIEKETGTDVAALPGSGAAGGLAAALMSVLNARVEPGAEAVLRWLKADDAFSAAQLVVTGEGCADRTTLEGKAPGAVSAMARRWGAQVVLVAGAINEASRALLEQRFDECLSLGTEARAPAATVEKALEVAGYALGRKLEARKS